MRKVRLAVLVLSSLLANALLAQEQASVVSVMVAEVEQADVTPGVHYVGRVEAIDTVALRARVQGFLEQRHFQEGRTVKAGDLLFTIEKAPYEIAVAQRQADLAGAEASLKNNRADLARKRDLVKKKLVSQAEVDTAVANEAVAAASVLQAQAALRSAELDLSYTEIYSPIDGQIGKAHYSIGSLVNTSSEPLATITRANPVYVTIQVSDKNLLEARRRGIDLDNPAVAPALTLADGSHYQHNGEFEFLDIQVDQSTDTVSARAEFPNPEGILIPGQFVSVSVSPKEKESALVVPQISVQRDQQGYFVLVVNQDDKVEVRRTEMGDQVDSAWVVLSGVEQGERVITQGVQKVRPDMTVNPSSDQS